MNFAMNARDRIHRALRNSAPAPSGRAAQPLPSAPGAPALNEALFRTVPADTPHERLLALFGQRLRETGGEMLPPVQASGLAAALRAFIESEGVQRIVADDEILPLLNSANGPPVSRSGAGEKTAGNQPPPAPDGAAVTPAGTASREALFAAEIGITTAQCAVAETGTIVLHYAPGRARLTSLAPPLHLVLLPVERLVPDLIEAVRDFGDGSGAVWITGPSKTADIGGILVRGIHGPGRIVVLPVRDYGKAVRRDRGPEWGSGG
ncbi:MAG: hypothetical protein Kow0059_20750 [Candidatus Sumerlaeia bacterium]